ncbi:MAG: hypothetical protein J6I84_04665 [Bacilli bacterium]|nr:hypothetical protein [Bacilli bacterium]
MYLIDSTYFWYESQIELKDMMSDSLSTDTIISIRNIFQDTIPKVYIYIHTFGVDSVRLSVRDDFVVGDSDMSSDSIKVTFDKAFQLMKNSGLYIPNSRYCTLRKEVGSKEANPQYIFGNDKVQIYVDAVTGNVSDTNPAY